MLKKINLGLFATAIIENAGKFRQLIGTLLVKKKCFFAVVSQVGDKEKFQIFKESNLLPADSAP